ncbi:hypothetical protein [Rubritalea tangerina]
MPVRYLDPSEKGQIYDVSDRDPLAGKYPGKDGVKFPSDENVYQLGRIFGAHFYSKNWGITYLYYSPNTPDEVSVLVFPDSERTYQTWEVEQLILKGMLSGVH